MNIKKIQLAKLRIIASTISITLLMMFFIFKGSILPNEGIKKVFNVCGELLSDIQIIPAFLGSGHGSMQGIVVIIIIFMITIVFGRFYCSGICPLGILQDISIATGKIIKKQKYYYHKGKRILWYAFFSLAMLCMSFGFSSVLGFIDPFSLFGKIITYGVRPLLVMIYFFFQNASDELKIYLLRPVEKIDLRSWVVLTMLGFTFCLMLMSVLKGRVWCNVICPVGAFLGLLSRFSILKINIADNCSQCGSCQKSCRGNCIDVQSKRVDNDRCVLCFECLDSCPSESVSYRHIHKSVKADNFDGTSRKQFLSMGMAATFSTISFLLKAKMAFADDYFFSTRFPNPPGAINQERFLDLCTGCGLCISKCPTGVLRPAVFEKGISGLMKPFLNYEKNSCEYKCNVCSEVCPTGAIERMGIVRKQKLSIGKAKFVEARCIVKVNNTACGACAEVCPTSALYMIKYKKGLKIPEIDETICIGCGACEYSCPVRPSRAVYVTGLKTQIAIGAKKPVKGNDPTSRKSSSKDFPF